MRAPTSSTIGYALVILAADALGCTNQICTGSPITCAGNADRCASIPGCSAVPACQYEGRATDRDCDELLTEASCQATTNSSCAWSASRCVSACGTLIDPQMCADFDPGRGFPCIWSTCSGIPDKPYCNRYPPDQCPSTLGCAVADRDPVGT